MNCPQSTNIALDPFCQSNFIVAAPIASFSHVKSGPILRHRQESTTIKIQKVVWIKSYVFDRSYHFFLFNLARQMAKPIANVITKPNKMGLSNHSSIHHSFQFMYMSLMDPSTPINNHVMPVLLPAPIQTQATIKIRWQVVQRITPSELLIPFIIQ